MTFNEEANLSKESLKLLLSDIVKEEIDKHIRKTVREHPVLNDILTLIVYAELAELCADISRARGGIKTDKEFEELRKRLEDLGTTKVK